MKRIFVLIIIFFILPVVVICIPREGRASHVAGSELIYEWLSDSTYRVFFKFFDDCGGNYAASSEFDLCYYNPCNGFSSTVKIKKMSLLPGNFPNGTPIGTGCPGVLTTCNTLSSVIPGFREWWYMVDLKLPSLCDNWIFSISVNARNPANNLVNAASNNLYIEATLNNLDPAGFSGGNFARFSSPYFSLKPIPYICLNVPMSYSGGPLDPDGDVLTYEFITPRHIGGNPATGIPSVGANCQPGYVPGMHLYNSPFTLQNPFATNNTFSFDTTTSLMTFTPSALGKNTVTVRVNKFRNGVKLGSVMRDVQFQVIPCNTAPISVNVIPTTVTGARFINERIEACAGIPFRFCFKVVANVPNAMLVVSDNHDLVLPGSSAVYNNQYTDSVLACITWSSRDTGLRLLSITARDSTCRAPGVIVPQTFVIPIYVRPAMKSLTERDICLGDTVRLSTNGTTNVRWTTSPGGSGSLSCTSCQNPVASPQQTTTYIAAYSAVNTCGTGDTITLHVTENAVHITPPGPLVLCHPDSVLLEAQAAGPKPLDSRPCGITSGRPVTPPDTTDLIVHTGGLQSTHNPGSSPFNGAYVTARHQYLVRAADMKRSGMHAGKLKSLSFYTAALNQTAFSNLTIALKCTGDSLDIAGNFQTGAVTVYTATAPVTVAAGIGWKDLEFDSFYEWDGVSDLLIEMCYANPSSTFPVYTGYYPTDYYATMYTYNFGGNICNGDPGINPFGILSRELPQMRFGWHSAEEKAFVYRWSGSAFTPPTEGRQVKTLIPGTTRIIVSVEGRNGCTPSDTLDIFIPQHAYEVHPDTVICEGASVSLYVRDTVLSGRPVSGSRWYEQDYQAPVTLSCDQCPEPVATPRTETLYSVIVTDSTGCRDTLQTRVKVDPFTRVEILNRDTVIGFGERLQLSALGADKYLWSPERGISNPGISNPVVTPEFTVVYVVEGRSGSCISYDSVMIRVDRRGLLFIPSAFTPNGDGVNDEFRVGNLTFQHLKEFRIFNRWGQEIFHTLSGKKGWDGTWKNQSQEMGVYHYLIRVGYPDGDEEIYKGDVTLVR